VGVVAKIKELAAKGVYGAEALKDVQPLFNQFGETVKKSVAAPAGQVDEDALAEKVAAKLMPAIGEMIAKSIAGVQVAQTPDDNTFASRSLQVVKPAEYNPENQRKLSQIERIANQTTGLG
jgi:hypothetical protein